MSETDPRPSYFELRSEEQRLHDAIISQAEGILASYMAAPDKEDPKVIGAVWTDEDQVRHMLRRTPPSTRIPNGPQTYMLFSFKIGVNNPMHTHRLIEGAPLVDYKVGDTTHAPDPADPYANLKGMLAQLETAHILPLADREPTEGEILEDSRYLEVIKSAVLGNKDIRQLAAQYFETTDDTLRDSVLQKNAEELISEHYFLWETPVSFVKRLLEHEIIRLHDDQHRSA